MTMTAEQLVQLREKARSASAGDWIKESGDGWEAVSSSDDQVNGGFIIAHFEGPDAKANREFMQAATPNVVLALLDELERGTAERDALREGEMGDAKHSNTRAAADIYFQLVEECEIPPGGSLVEHIDSMRERIAELEARTVTVKLPHQFKTSMYGTPLYEQCDILAMLADAGINLTVEG